MDTHDDLLELLKRYTNLGHAKKNDAFLRQVQLFCLSPGAHSSEASGKASSKIPLADVLSMYRFMDNENIPLCALRDARSKTILSSIPSGSDLIIIHDMSPLDYSAHNSKRDRRAIGNHRGMGYEYVACVAVSAKTETTLGVIHDTVISKDGPDDTDVMNYDYDPLFKDFSEKEKKRLAENHRHQMAVHINGTSSLLSQWHVIDVGDREFDDIFILERCESNNRDFVIRAMGNRNVQIPQYEWIREDMITKKQSGHPLKDGYVCVNLKNVIHKMPLLPYKSLALDSRGHVVDERSAKRIASLSIGTCKIHLYRDAKRNIKYYKTSRPVDINMVIIRETDPPKGVKPLCWILFTSLPTDTFEQMSHVAHSYELRWKVEDFFRLLKSGYKILDSRLNNAQKTARYIIISTLAAMVVLQLKQKIGLGSTGYLSDEEYENIKTAMIEPENKEIDINVRLFAFMAKNGGWLARRRDPIGPTVLMRGVLHLLAILDAVTRYGPLIEEALKNPEVIRRLLCV